MIFMLAVLLLLIALQLALSMNIFLHFRLQSPKLEHNLLSTGDCQCGVSDVKTNKIAGGTDALSREFPWQVALRE